LPGSVLKVCVVGWWVGGKLSDRLWLSLSLALAKPNNTCYQSPYPHHAKLLTEELILHSTALLWKHKWKFNFTFYVLFNNIKRLSHCLSFLPGINGAKKFTAVLVNRPVQRSIQLSQFKFLTKSKFQSNIGAQV
jgi:hypothetical protein